MNVADINKHLKIPDGYKVTHLCAEGSFLRVECRRLSDDSVSVVDIYLNDMGREVARSAEEIDRIDNLEAYPDNQRVLSYSDVKWWDRWFVRLQLFILGLQEKLS
jgi:hypothetical protein